MGGTVKTISSPAEFQTQINASSKPALVDFTASWCGPCKAIAPYLEKLAAQHGAKLNFFKVDVDENQEVASQYGVRAMPTFLLFDKGQVAEEVVGANPDGLADICRRWAEKVSTFSGASRKLSDATPAEPQPEAAAAASEGGNVDEAQPVTTLQIRTADGVRHISKFNTSTTVGQLRSFIRDKHPKGPSKFSLMTGVPPKYVNTDDSATLEQADLIDAVVIQRP